MHKQGKQLLEDIYQYMYCIDWWNFRFDTKIVTYLYL